MRPFLFLLEQYHYITIMGKVKKKIITFLLNLAGLFYAFRSAYIFKNVSIWALVLSADS